MIQCNVTIVGMPNTWLNDIIYDLHGLQCCHFIEQHRSYLGGRDLLCARGFQIIQKGLTYLSMIMVLSPYSMKSTKTVCIEKNIISGVL